MMFGKIRNIKNQSLLIERLLGHLGMLEEVDFGVEPLSKQHPVVMIVEQYDMNSLRLCMLKN